MFNKLELYLFNIQSENWGFPWHIILSMLLFFILYPVIGIWVTVPFKLIVFTFVAVQLIGQIYEMIQKAKGKNSRSDYWQDTAANAIGSILAILVLAYIMFMMSMLAFK